MFYFFKLIRRVFTKEQTMPPHRHKPVQAPNCGNTDKRKAQSEAAIKAVIEGLPKAKVIYVVDGDTVVVARRRSQITIRLDSIDCPEDGQYWGDTATYGLIKLIGGRNVHLEEHGMDIHGRTLVDEI